MQLPGFAQAGFEASLRALFSPTGPCAQARTRDASVPCVGATPPTDRRTSALVRRRIWRVGKQGEADERLILATAIPPSSPTLDAQPGEAFSRAAATRVLLVVHTPGALEGLDTSLLADTFGLTRAETGVARAAARGDDPQDIADTRFVSRETVRTQMRTLYRKLGVKRQADLVRIISQLPRFDFGAPAESTPQHSSGQRKTRQDDARQHDTQHQNQRGNQS